MLTLEYQLHEIEFLQQNYLKGLVRDMTELLNIAPSITSPFSLIALFIIVLLILYKAIIKSNFFPQFTQTAGAEIIQNIVNKVFWLLIVLMALIYIIPLISSMVSQDKKISCYPRIEKTLNVGSSGSIFNDKYKFYITQADETVCTLKINNQKIEIHGSETQEIDLDSCKYNITRVSYDSSKNACTIAIEPAAK